MSTTGLRQKRLNEAQIASRKAIAERHGAEFDVYHRGRSQYALPMGDHDKPAVRDLVDRTRDAIRRDDQALTDGAPEADW